MPIRFTRTPWSRCPAVVPSTTASTTPTGSTENLPLEIPIFVASGRLAARFGMRSLLVAGLAIGTALLMAYSLVDSPFRSVSPFSSRIRPLPDARRYSTSVLSFGLSLMSVTLTEMSARLFPSAGSESGRAFR